MTTRLSTPKLSKAKMLALVALLAAVAFGASATIARAYAPAPEPGPTECDNGFSEKTLAGCFGWSSTAFVNSSTAQATAAIGLMHLDGAGQLKGWYSGSYLGSPTVRDYKGKYVVNPNGTGHMSFTDNYGWTLEYDFVIVKGGDEVLMSNTLTGNIQNIEMKRQ
ncbi:MAG TPA: hypothetical protein VGP08_10070 [Pyrinomonadaceae bacterium]|jgi:hypothetical protein|nr:hypothetical protein [Pyrinomonadaceae bacterium]